MAVEYVYILSFSIILQKKSYSFNTGQFKQSTTEAQSNCNWSLTQSHTQINPRPLILQMPEIP